MYPSSTRSCDTELLFYNEFPPAETAAVVLKDIFGEEPEQELLLRRGDVVREREGLLEIPGEEKQITAPPDAYRLIKVGDETMRFLVMAVPKVVDTKTRDARLLLIELFHDPFSYPYFEEKRWTDMAQSVGCPVEDLLVKLQQSPFVEETDNGLQWIPPESSDEQALPVDTKSDETAASRAAYFGENTVTIG